jgi:hypothetical protein
MHGSLFTSIETEEITYSKDCCELRITPQAAEGQGCANGYGAASSAMYIQIHLNLLWLSLRTINPFIY